MLARWLFRWTMRLWIRRATRSYGGPGQSGELFNTACFQRAVAETASIALESTTARNLLLGYGLHSGWGGCHWFATWRASQATYPNLVAACNQTGEPS